ncbi:MAG: DUF6261 family protein [Tannerellaceae bacterium]|nr:DUF6261 family protein [Tannerellaceae bacterium]
MKNRLYLCRIINLIRTYTMQKPIKTTIKTQLRLLYTSEHIGFFAGDIVVGINPVIASVPSLQPLYTALQNKVATEEALFKKILASSLTPELSMLHRERISAIGVIQATVRHAQFSQIEDIRKAHHILTPLVKTYKKVKKATYPGASGMIENLIADCRSAEYWPHVQALGMAQLINRTGDANDLFSKKFMERAVDHEIIARQGKVSLVKPEVNNAFMIFLDGVNTAYIINELGANDPALKENLTKIIDVVNAAVTEMKNILARRGHHRASRPPGSKASGAGRTGAKPQSGK